MKRWLDRIRQRATAWLLREDTNFPSHLRYVNGLHFELKPDDRVSIGRRSRVADVIKGNRSYAALYTGRLYNILIPIIRTVVETRARIGTPVSAESAQAARFDERVPTATKRVAMGFGSFRLQEA